MFCSQAQSRYYWRIFLGRHQLYDPNIPETLPYRNKKGVQGVCLFVLPQYRKLGLGRQLRNLCHVLSADDIWGEHPKSLNNLPNWISYGRVHVTDIDDYHITVMDLK